MRGTRRCTVCGEQLEPNDAVECEDCNALLHTACVDYHISFDCPTRGTDLAVGAVEF